ncbi:NADPH-dependent FMN reductase [Candidatus Roizmanbacteria bacterium CG22_combo_CG10-13_8_21_14_all_38_20]|uniref:NADPH-dependent FMN reductase n=1 Tax=Candidatus Roizmanbacteria bacterium CG22_combo_CG10-13_8_21_14_all_38_20 TaxID=1974862 RepID=A0A2H0BV01_9BACT|nr:NAD(P)H-dependent oxidoreductase [Candidatus Microgenomates bacterium]PIP61503.1 MAG: NADPH-dependent FMN reductase [Candidatus Roizmanbacteria bacterium CG22_combo_CG10-13_8_21_14_all_38_20]PJC32269.1 MAG: NADPH-dependent FMN reductase [Candidatus Roizmanbacteria bacterium CG_4_9_14_0_2_um_filter_38_17]
MPEELYLPVIEGTTRPGRQSLNVAKFLVEIGNAIDGVKSELVDPTNFNLPGDGKDEENKDSKYSKITKEADGFFVVVPEYNHAYPGTLKRLLDSELKNYRHKPVSFAGVSAGPWGGVRGIENLIPVVRELGLVATFGDIQFPSVQNIFNSDGKIEDPELKESYAKRANKAWNELIWMTKALKWGRDNL